MFLLSALYAAAMFIIGRIPLEKIFLIATPLHSQNFIIEKEGLITNNRRIVTRNMWFNGTSLSAKARRAMENEKVTIVSHISGYIHTLYKEATIDKEAYNWFSVKLREFLETELNNPVFINFLRFKSKYKSLFQFRCECAGVNRYIALEKIFEYEHTSKFNLSVETRELLVKEIEGDEFHLSPIQGKIMFNDIEQLLEEMQGKNLDDIEYKFICRSDNSFADIIHEMFSELRKYIFTDPRIPDTNKTFIRTIVPPVSTNNSRKEIIDSIAGLADESELCLLTLYTFRQMDMLDWLPFVKASLERNPVCFTDLNGKSITEVFDILKKMPNHSIYEGKRLALPDEVWNYKCGDGIEKALLLTDYILQKNGNAHVTIEITHKDVRVKYLHTDYNFRSEKEFRKTIKIDGNKYSIE